ncbi:2,3-bisphosphoglycerate-independent phosphoglycerate mutase [Azospirillum brasilense]|uniref:2,3-bisphosphoglycerate-independent phosphoglycerate mutase n=1 Tax=Azospirillum brasilense TaxID=192 RepID=UPI00190C9092|nr:2,3-bisphosphoglycerate-independent phosphoglycerate mutase [Azospirillum brasilense]MBK3736936.1 2,3-bisphosphoglycerate-independent phosphoglycerate mutase [Azospirillum brasilense]
MTETNRPRPVVLCILDGWGYREEREDNAIAQGNTPNWDRLWSSEPRAFLEASEEEVGLPKGQMGNSEVGHMNLGAGRVVRQDLVMIDHAIVEGELERNVALNDLAKTLLASGGRCHILGLLSPGGVHSHQDHIAALAGVLAHEGVPVEIHAFTDGRDVPPQSAKDQMAEFMADVHALPGVNVATVSGRYYAMDRDKRWDRVAKAYAALVSAEGLTAADPIQAIEQSYAAGTHDEFILPTVIDGYAGMKDGDAILMANFRADRAREILAAFVDPAFDGFERASVPKLAAAVGMVEYSSTLAKLMTTIFPPKSLTKVLGEVVSEAGLTQLRIAETEKYPHVTFFFNGGEERVYPGEDRILVPSPKVATYDLQPEMSAAEVTDKVVAAVDSGKYDLVVINYANPDMVGHSGILSAAIKAVEAVDVSLGRLEAAVRAQGGVMLVTADHGNCELMRDPQTNGPHTAHTLDKVPLVLVNGPAGVSAIRSGRLADIAPTLLDLMKLPQPAEMTGKSLIDRASARAAAE